MFLRRFYFALAGLLVAWPLSSAHAQLSKGYQILINRGLQIEALASSDCYVHLATYSNANYTTFDWFDPSRPENDPDGLWMGPAPGVLPWARWAGDQTRMPPLVTPYGDEAPYMSQLVSLQLGDEFDLNNDTTRGNLINWFLAVSNNFTNTLLYHNNFGGQVGDAQLADFYTRAHPDMLSFDTYPWQSVWDGNQSNHIGAALSGPPTGWYGDLRRYRQHAWGAGIPMGIYRQTFHSVEDYDTRVYRDPSPSELRLNTFAALAFNAKFIADFVYNVGACSLFNITFNGSGDSFTNALYNEMADVNLRAKNFGKTLVYLQPVNDAVANTYTTGIMFIRGKYPDGSLTPVPNSFVADPQDPNLYTDWAFLRNDIYLTNTWAVTNKGTKNNGNPGDVIVSWFKPLDESFDGPAYNNETYIMVVNGLSDPTGSAADCQQEIRLNFLTSLLAVDMMNPTNGQVEVKPLTLTNGFRQLVLNLNGGDAALFKFADGAPFIGSTVVGPPVIVRQPVNQITATNLAGFASVAAEGGGPMSYQWRKNGTGLSDGGSVSGSATATLIINNAQASDAASYSVVVSNALGTVTSSNAVITLTSPIQWREPFNYTGSTALSGQTTPTGQTWADVGTGTAGPAIAATNGNLTLPYLAPSSGNSILFGGLGKSARLSFSPSVSSGTLYFSCAFKVLDLTGASAGGGFFVGFNNSVGTQAGQPTVVGTRVYLRTVAGGFNFGVAKNSDTDWYWDSTVYTTNQTIFLVGSYTLNTGTTTDDIAKLWINPNPATYGAGAPPGPTLTAATGNDLSGNLASLVFFQRSSIVEPAAMIVDELRVANTWASVTPSFTPVRFTSNSVLANGSVRLQGVGDAGHVSVDISTNMTSWSQVANTLGTNGVFEYIDSTPNILHRFYRGRFVP